MAISYWLVPQITGKRLQHRTLAMVQPYLWFVGMTLMSNAMHRAGLAGVPRRTAEPMFEDAGAAPFETVAGTIGEMRLQIAVGGVLLFVSLAMFLVVMFGTWLTKGGVAPLSVDSHIPAPLSGPEGSPRVLDNLKLWTAIAVLLVALAYGLPIWSIVSDCILTPGAPPIPV